MSIIHAQPLQHRACWLGELALFVCGRSTDEGETWHPSTVEVIVQYVHDSEAQYSEIAAGNWCLAHIGEAPYILTLNRDIAADLTTEDITAGVDDLAALLGDQALAEELSAAALALFRRWSPAKGPVAMEYRFDDMARFNTLYLDLAAKAAENSGIELNLAEQKRNLQWYWNEGADFQLTRFEERRELLSAKKLPDFEREVNDFFKLREAGITAANAL